MPEGQKHKEESEREMSEPPRRVAPQVAPPKVVALSAVPADVWLTDRSRIQRGRIHCQRARYLEYHSGPCGCGIRRKAESLPLATGGQIHDLLAAIIQQRPDQEKLRALVLEARADYVSRVTRRGLLELLDEGDPEQAMQRAELQRVVSEQGALIEAIGLAAGWYWIPKLLDEFDPVLVEQEIVLDLGRGIHLMLRPDLIARRKVGGGLVQIEFKTHGGYADSAFWTKQWLHNVQLTLTKIGCSLHLKEDVGQAYIFGIDKGRREKEQATGLQKQWSPFLYAYHKPANPPFEAEDWQTRWKWVDEFGANHTLGKKYKREATYDYRFEGLPEGVSLTAYWVSSMPQEEIERQRVILGPYQFLEHAQHGILRSLVEDELRWVEKLWAIHQAGEVCGWQEGEESFQAELDTQVPQSWQCHQYGKDCPFLPICTREAGWEDPLGSGRYEVRRPHHQPELDQLKKRGIEVPEDQDDGEAGEGGE